MPETTSPKRTDFPGGGHITLLVGSAQTGGKWSLFDYVAPPGLRGPLPHFHREMEETFHVLEGHVTFGVGGDVRTFGPGETVVVPPGTLHHFRNDGEMTFRMLVHMSPGGLEAYFPELVALVRASPVWPPVDPGPILELMARHDSFPAPR